MDNAPSTQSISTGVYSYPLEEAAEIAVATVEEFIENHPGELDFVEWVLFDQATYDVYDKALGQMTVSKIVYAAGHFHDRTHRYSRE